MEATETNHKIRIGKRIAELRKEKGLSQTRLAQLIGFDRGYIAKIELGTFDIGIENLSKISSALGVMIDLIPV